MMTLSGCFANMYRLPNCTGATVSHTPQSCGCVLQRGHGISTGLVSSVSSSKKATHTRRTQGQHSRALTACYTVPGLWKRAWKHTGWQ